MLANRLFFESDVTTPLGYISLIGTSSGANRTNDRVMGEYAWVYSVAGKADYRDELGTAQALHPGDGVIIFPGLRHWYGAVPDETWEHIYFVFEGPVFNLLETQGLFDRASPITQIGPIDAWVDRYLTLADRPRPETEADAMIMVGDFVQLLLTSLASSSHHQTWLSRARVLLDSDISRPADFERVAADLGTTYETFRKRFRAEAGEPPSQYRNRRRIAIVRDLLASTSLSLRQIAASLGYSDEFHLSKRFKTAMGISPREYRSAGPPPRESLRELGAPTTGPLLTGRRHGPD